MSYQHPDLVYRNLTYLSEMLEIFKQHAKIAIIYSGDNREEGAVVHATYHPRHWKSYAAVASDICETLVESGFRDVITLPDDMRLIERLRSEAVDLVWLNTGGIQGQNAIAHGAALLEMAGIPYIGHNPLNYALLDHKPLFKRHLLGLGLPTPEFTVWDPATHLHDNSVFLAEFRRSLGAYPAPWIVKPATGRGSRFISVVYTEKQLITAVKEVYLETSNTVLVERFMQGREFCVAAGSKILANDKGLHLLDQTLVFGFLEKLLQKDEIIFTSQDKRPIDSQRASMLNPETQAKLIGQLQDFARKICDSLGLNYLIRLDLREDERGELYILEANPKPDLKRPRPGIASLVAIGLEGIGITYNQLLTGLLSSEMHHSFSFRSHAVSSLKKLITTHDSLVKGRV